MSRFVRSPLFLGLGLLLAVMVATLSQAASPVHAATLNVNGADAGCSDVTGTPYCTIGAAVLAANAGDTINIFPGTYAESVDLSTMATPGDITLTTVNASGTPTPSTVTVSPAAGQAFQAGCTFPGSITIDGFIVLSLDDDGIDLCADGDITIKNVTANGNYFDGIVVESDPGNVTITNVTANGNLDGDGIDARSNNGNVTVTNVTANGNSSDGVDAEGSGNLTITDSTANDNGDNGFDNDVDGDVAVSGSSADNNEDEGFVIDGFESDAAGDVTVTDSSANGSQSDDGFEIDAASVAVSNSTANDNDDEGFDIVSSGAVTLDRVTAIGNVEDGIDVEGASEEEGTSVGNVTISNSLTQNNLGDGIEYLEPGTLAGATQLANGNIICDNAFGIELNEDITVNAEGNWWGAATGPFDAVDNPAGTGDDVSDSTGGAAGTVDFTPWIDTVSGSGSAIVGQASTISFEFKGGAGAVAFAEGPGDTTGAPTFTSATSNGTATTSGFVSGGKLNVSLTASTVGTANVTVTGPCGITGSFAVAVAAAPVAPTPTVVQLPRTGGAPANGGALPWLAALVGALALTSGGLALAYRTRRIR